MGEERKFKFKKTEDTLPHSTDAEDAVLGCIISNAEVHGPDAKEFLKDSFYSPVNQQLFGELVWMLEHKKPIDDITFTQHLTDKGILDQVGGAGHISSLSQPTTSAAYDYYKGILIDKRRSRELILAARSVESSVLSSQADLASAETEIEKLVSTMKTAIRGRDNLKPWDLEIDEFMADWDEIRSGHKESAMETRWASWNNEVGGIDPGYTIISGRSSSGKSCLLGNILLDAALNKRRPALFISYEMPVRMVLARLVADVADVDGKHLFRPDKSQPEPYISKAINAALERIRKSPLRIIHNPNLSADAACHMARKMWLEHKDLVVGVDYLQIAPRPTNVEKGANREREISTISSTFRNFSKEIDCPLVVLSQLNQDGSTRESTSIMMDADSIFRVDREKDIKTGKVKENGVTVMKARNGRSDFNLPLFLDGPRFRFVER